MNDRTNGYLLSGAIHAACLSLLLLLPDANPVPIKTFHIRFVQSGADTEEAPKAKPPVARQRMAAPHPHLERVPKVKEKKAVPPPVQEKKLAEAVRPLPPPVPEPTATIHPSSLSPASDFPSVPKAGAAAGGSAQAGAKASVSAANPAGRSSSNTDGVSSVVETQFGDLDAPTFIHRELPVYPRVARRMEKEGRVVLKLLIDQTGKLRKVEVLEGAAFGFTEAAVEAVQKSIFAPARRKGEKIAAWAILPVRFRME